MSATPHGVADWATMGKIGPKSPLPLLNFPLIQIANSASSDIPRCATGFLAAMCQMAGNTRDQLETRGSLIGRKHAFVSIGLNMPATEKGPHEGTL